MRSKYFRDAISFFLMPASAFFCALIILLMGVLYTYNQALQLRRILDIPFDADNGAELSGAGLASLVCCVPILYCGAALARFCLRAAPPRFSGKVRFGALILFILPALLLALSVVNFVLFFLFFPEAFLEDRLQSINTFIFGVLFLVGFGAFTFVLLKRHLKPLSFLDKPYVLFLRRFSKFSDRTLTSLVLRQTLPSQPIAFLVPPVSRAGDWNPLLIGFGGMKLLHPFRSVPIIVKSRITEWEQAMRVLIKDAQFVVVDVSEKSEAIQLELEMIDELAAWNKTILLKALSNKPDDEQERIESEAAQIIYYRKSWLRAFPRMIVGLNALSLAAVPVAIAIEDGPTYGPTVDLFLVLFGILAFACIYVPFFVRPSIDRKTKLWLKKILRSDRRAMLQQRAPPNLSWNQARDQS